mmetsp:Transcript_24967/g.22682  ORF Transcript_24967/g.22682 Transcript_24967/m.22682 type:complete len:1033 (+) Transcript_24967:86-3184(+)
MTSNSSSISTATTNVDQSEAIKVVVRIRPMQKQEKQKGEKVCVKPLALGKEVQIKTDLLEAQIYKCNHCFSRDTSQSKFFEESNITSLIDSSIAGYRSCAFAFGQTGAGKTYTVVGPSKSISPGHENDGLIGRSLDYLYNQLKGLNTKFSVRLSCLEIYHENVYDLLSDERNRPSLAIREHSIEGFFLEGCKMVSCQTFKQACSVIDIAMRNRHIGEHELNARSSRSHCITEIYIDLPNRRESPVDNLEESDEIDNSSSSKTNNSTTIRQRDFVSTGKLTLVDLAGSERLKSTHSTGKVLQDAGYINKSLYVLGKVIAGLARTHGDINHRDVPYRDSKLTKILINSLGGRGRTLLIACVTEASGSQAETLRTLKFSMSCARIKNRPVKFLDPQEKLITELREEIKRLRLENKKLRSSLLSAPSDSRRVNKVESPNDIDNESLPFRRAISAEENLTINNNKKIKSNNKTKKYMKNNYSDSVIRPSDDRVVHSPTDQRIRILEERLATLELNKQSKSKPYSLSPDSNDKAVNKVVRNQVQHVDAVDLLEQRNKKKIKFISNYEKPKNNIIEKPSNNNIVKSQPIANSNKLKTIPKPKLNPSNENESHTVSGDILAEYLNSVDLDEDDNDIKKKKKKITKDSNANSRNNNISKKVSPYVAHLASNPKRIKEIITDRPVPIKSKAIPYSDKRAYNSDDESNNDKLLNKIEKKVNPNELPNIKISSNSPNNNQIIKDKEIENVVLPSISPKQSPFKLSPSTSKNINKFNLENEDHSIERVTTKLTELEKQLINTRQEMEDSPGDVTADAENNLLKLEREVVEMKRELQLSIPNSPVKMKVLSPVTSNKSPIRHKDNKDDEDDYYDETFDDNEVNHITNQIELIPNKSNVNDNIIMTTSSPKVYIDINDSKLADSKSNNIDLVDIKKSNNKDSTSTNDDIIYNRITNDSESKSNENYENNLDNYYDDSFADINQNKEVDTNQFNTDNATIKLEDNISDSNIVNNKIINGFTESKRNGTKDEIKDEDLDHYGYEDDFDD